MGTTGPNSLNPETNKIYGLEVSRNFNKRYGFYSSRTGQ